MNAHDSSYANEPFYHSLKSTIDAKLVYAAIEGNLLAAAEGEQKKTFLLTSSISGEGKTFTTLVMAHALASHSNAKVLLIDGNIHAPQLSNAFDVKINAKKGTLEYFSSENEPEEFVVESGYQNIFLMPLSDNYGLNGGGRFNYLSFSKQLERLKKSDFDYILFDGSAIMGFSETLAIARFFDSVVLVVECEKTKWEVVQLAKEKLSMVKAKPLGTILNKRNFPIPSKFYF